MDDNIACQRCGWVYMSAPDRTLHQCACEDQFSADWKSILEDTAQKWGWVAMRANDRQEGGDHYKTKAIQPWDYAIANDLDFMQGSIIKYVTRFRDKNGLADLRKARHFLDKLIEVEEGKIVGNG